jgi:predicted metal-binding membrane protein
VTLVLGVNSSALPLLCSAELPAALSGRLVPDRALIELALVLNPPARLAGGWTLMVAAMMLPLQLAPVRHIRARSFARRRWRAIALFLAGYAAVWLAAGAVLVALALLLRLDFADSVGLLIGGAMLAAVWQASPLKQLCLNHCHDRPALAAFGRAADRDVLVFGLTQGLWCFGAGWALMLLPLLVAQGHLWIMAVVSLWLAGERFDGPRLPEWGWRGPGKGLRIVLGQARSRLAARGQSPSAIALQ